MSDTPPNDAGSLRARVNDSRSANGPVNPSLAATALIAEDEPLLARVLAAELHALWPALRLVASVGDGRQAVEQLLLHQPDIAFLDIRMPGATGLEVVQEVAEEWPDNGARPMPLFVFVTAFGEFALQAFDHAAVDYLLKPVRRERLGATLARLQVRLNDERQDKLAALASELGAMLAAQAKPGAVAAGTVGGASVALGVDYLRTIRASVGDTVRIVPVHDVVMLEAADKYVIVHAAGVELLIRESLRELLPRLDPARFVQVHRSTIVNLDHVEAAVRDESSRLTLRLRQSDRRPVVSRLYRHLFQAM